MSWDYLLAHRIRAQLVSYSHIQKYSCIMYLTCFWACSRQVWRAWRFLTSSWCAGEAGVSPAQQEVSVSGPVSGIPEALHLTRSDQDAGVTQTPKRAVPRQNTRLRPRLQVYCVYGCVMHLDVVTNLYAVLQRTQRLKPLPIFPTKQTHVIITHTYNDIRMHNTTINTIYLETWS